MAADGPLRDGQAPAVATPSWMNATGGADDLPSLTLVDLDLPLPHWRDAAVAIEPLAGEPGYWAGAPTAVYHDGVYYLAYRLRRPVGKGRGYGNVIARSLDGVHFETVCRISRDTFGAESLERPALVRTPAGRWRLYVSCATPNTKHWRVDMLEADDPADLCAADHVTVLPGNGEMAVKDPVIRFRNGRWHLWASCHPLDDEENTDRMVTRYATSDDGITWEWQATALAGQRGSWDARGVRVATVLPDELTRPLLPELGAGPDDDLIVAFYDGRATAAENWEERTGVAVGRPSALLGVGDVPAAQSPHALRGLRYSDVIAVPGGCRIYYEATRADGAHELRTELLPRPVSRLRSPAGLAVAAGE